MKHSGVNNLTYPADGFMKTAFYYLLSVLFLLLLLAFSPVAQAEQAVPDHVGTLQTHTTVYEDTLVQIARRYNLGFIELRAANQGIDPWIPGADIELTLPTMHILPKGPREGVVINLPEMRLYAFVNPGEPPVTHPIGVGRVGLSTPLGKTTVVRKKIGPVWRPTDRMREEDPKLPEQIGPGLDNPMGTHALYLGWPEYALHGTNKPFGIGRRSSSGCIRLYPEDIVTMFDQIEEGTPVTVVDQPVKVAWIGDSLYMEAHTTLAQADKMEQEGVVETYEFTGENMAAIVAEAGPYADFIDWSAVRRSIRERRGVPEIIATRPDADQQAAEPDLVSTGDNHRS